MNYNTHPAPGMVRYGTAQERKKSFWRKEIKCFSPESVICQAVMTNQ